ncbi:MAG TPA: hypothetical protein VLX68_14230 [Chitinivibrionales bacterium]|nr:hypothetical protein [Chitinivibrionales bacterium]
MTFSKVLVTAAAALAAASMLLNSVAAQNAGVKSDSAKTAAAVKELRPQTTCPVMGGPINKNLYVDYKGKRIYVCCEGCLAEVKKNPEKYIKKLADMGQGVETIVKGDKKGAPAAKDTSAARSKVKKPGAKSDTSMDGMKM